MHQSNPSRGTFDFLSSVKSKRGMTLIEVVTVIGLLTLMSYVGFTSANRINYYKVSMQASAALKTVRQAQTAYLAYHPNLTYYDIPSNNTEFLTYFQGGVMPVLPVYDGAALTIDASVFPPVILKGGVAYDPSTSTTDGVWDSGP